MHFRISGLSGFLPFSLIRRVFLKKAQEDWTTLIPITRNWQSQYWYLELLNMSINNPILLPKKMNLFVDPKINIHPLIKTNIFQLAAWKIPAADETAETKVMSQQAAILVKILDGQEHKLAANRPGKSELAGVQKYRNWSFLMFCNLCINF